MESGVFGQWLKQDGEAVAVGEPVFSIEGGKGHRRGGVRGRGRPAHPPGRRRARCGADRRDRDRLAPRRGRAGSRGSPRSGRQGGRRAGPESRKRRRQVRHPLPLPRSRPPRRSRLPSARGRTAGLPPAPGPDESRESSASTGGWPPDPARGAVSASATSARLAAGREPGRRCAGTAAAPLPDLRTWDRSRWCR